MTEAGSPSSTVADALGIAGKVIAFIGGLAGQLPSFMTVTGWFPLSLYQPLIYRGKEWFLLIPLVLGVLATCSVIRWGSAKFVVGGLGIILAIFVYWALVFFPVSSPMHPINWILSYCVIALGVAAITGGLIDRVRPT
jgi:hypothetical protein